MLPHLLHIWTRIKSLEVLLTLAVMLMNMVCLQLTYFRQNGWSFKTPSVFLPYYIPIKPLQKTCNIPFDTEFTEHLLQICPFYTTIPDNFGFHFFTKNHKNDGTTDYQSRGHGSSAETLYQKLSLARFSTCVKQMPRSQNCSSSTSQQKTSR